MRTKQLLPLVCAIVAALSSGCMIEDDLAPPPQRPCSCAHDAPPLVAPVAAAPSAPAETQPAQAATNDAEDDDDTATYSPGGWFQASAKVTADGAKVKVAALPPPAIANDDPTPAPAPVGDKTNAYGKYTKLIKVLRVPQDDATYGPYDDYGYWGPGEWAGAPQPAGYWVYVSPDWYIYAEKTPGK